VAFPYEVVFVALLVAYMVVSEWERLDSRYPIVAGLVLLVVAAIADAAGATATANTLAVYVFFLLGAGVILLLVDYVRESRRSPSRDSLRAPAEPEASTSQPPGPPPG
jgi:uncharacterized membrane protein